MEITQSKLTAKRPWIFRSRGRMFLSLFLVLAIPTAILTLLTTLFVYEQLTEQATTQNTVAAQLGARQIQEEFFGLRRYVESFATRRRLIDSVAQSDSKTVNEQLAEMFEQNHKISRVVVTDRNGVLLFDFPHDPAIIGKDFSYRDWFIGASSSEDPYVSEFYQREALGKKSVVTITARIREQDDKTIGYLAAQYAITDLKEWLSSVRLAESGRMTLFDQNGNQAITPDSPGEENIRNHPVIHEILQQPAGTVKVRNLGGYAESLLSHVPIPDLGWTVVAYQPTDVIYAPIQGLLRTILVFFLLALLAIGLLGWLWFRMLHAYSEDMRRSNLELQNFCYSIAHDLRAPLRAMRGFSIVLQEDYAGRLDETGSDYARRIAKASERMDRLINDLLDYGKIAHRSLHLEQVILDNCVRRAVEELWGQIELQHAEIEIQERLGKVSADQSMLQLVLVHLLSNAIKYVAPGKIPKVRICSENKGASIRLYIEDNGIGIIQPHVEKIFGIFQRLHPDEAYSGTGVGLAIVKKAAERMGGSVGVESNEGEGSSFWIELPKH